jgi:hypothetical protein
MGHPALNRSKEEKREVRAVIRRNKIPLIQEAMHAWAAILMPIPVRIP